MTVMDLTHTIRRIKSAHPRSPIAVFRCDQPLMLNSVFANTAITKDLIRGKSRNLIGVYHGQMNMERVRQQLVEGLRREPYSNGHAERV